MTLTTDIATRLQPARSELLAGVPGVAHGVSHRVAGLGRADGNIGLGSPRDKADAWAMRQLWAEAIGVDPHTIVTGGQVHGTDILRVVAADAGKGSREGFPQIGIGDGMITDAPGVTLLTLHADCQPILLVDPDRPAVAAVHAGWRGTVANIAGAAVAAMCQAYGTRPSGCWRGSGPALGPCCHETGPEVTAAWRRPPARSGSIRSRRSRDRGRRTISTCRRRTGGCCWLRDSLTSTSTSRRSARSATLTAGSRTVGMVLAPAARARSSRSFRGAGRSSDDVGQRSCEAVFSHRAHS